MREYIRGESSNPGGTITNQIFVNRKARRLGCSDICAVDRAEDRIGREAEVSVSDRGSDLLYAARSGLSGGAYPSGACFREPDIAQPARFKHIGYLRTSESLFQPGPETIEGIRAHDIKTAIRVQF